MRRTRARRPALLRAARAAIHARIAARRTALVRAALAGSLGAGAALLVACGGTSTKLIPSADAGPLQSDFETVAQAAEGGAGCAATETALAHTVRDFNALPPSVDAGLRDRLHEGITKLHAIALSACSQSQTQTTTQSKTTPRTTTTQTSQTSTSETQTTTSTTSTPTEPSETGAPNGGGTPVPEGAGAGGTGVGEGNEGEGAPAPGPAGGPVAHGLARGHHKTHGLAPVGGGES